MNDRWLVLAHEATNSGAPRMLLEVLRGVRAERGPDWHCEILLDRGGPLAAELATFGTVRRLTPPWAEGMDPLARCFRLLVDRPWLKPRRLQRAVRAWRDRGGNLIFCNTATNGHLLAALPAGAGPVVTYLHESGYGLRRFCRPHDLAATLARTDLFLAVSSAAAIDLQDCGVVSERIRVVPNFLPCLPPPLNLETAQATLFRRLQLLPGTRIVTGCGYLDPVKGTDIFVAMVDRLANEVAGPVVGIWIGGDADREFAADVRQRARGRVHFVGEVADPTPWFAGSDVVAVTSRVESFSRVALESAALGRPVVAFTAARGPADLLPGEALVLEQTPEAIAVKVKELLEDRVGADRLGANLRERVAAGFLADTCVPRILAAIAEVRRV